MIYFTSDTHFSHRLLVEQRGYGSVEAMDRDLIRLWNDTVKPEDTVYHLGDVSFAGAAKTEAIVRQLQGEVHLIPGNHDNGQQVRRLERLGWTIHPPIERLTLDNGALQIVLCHYPLLTWRSSHYGALHFHGHSHGNLLGGVERATRTDVGVDASWGRAPVDLPSLVATLRQRKYEVVDHHDGSEVR